MKERSELRAVLAFTLFAGLLAGLAYFVGRAPKWKKPHVVRRVDGGGGARRAASGVVSNVSVLS